MWIAWSNALCEIGLRRIDLGSIGSPQSNWVQDHARIGMHTKVMLRAGSSGGDVFWLNRHDRLKRK